MLDDLALFIRIAQNRSLSAAAKQLGVPPATVTRRLRKLEEGIGAQLVHRSARKFALTSEGEVYFEAFADLLQQAETSLRGLSADLNEMRGPLRVAAPTNISVGMLEPMWSSFLKTYPDIQLTLQLSNENQDLLENRIDLALRFGPQTDQRLYQKHVGRVATMLVAAPDYLAKAGAPERPEELQSHKLIWVPSLPHWQLQNMDTQEKAAHYPAINVAVDDIGLACQLSAGGHGIALLPVTETSGNILAGQLKFVLPRWCGQTREAYAVWPTGRLLSARAKCLRDFMETYMAERLIFQGELPESGVNQAV